MVSQITFKSNATVRLTTTNAYDNLNRRTVVSSTPSADSVVSFNYGYNSANQRTAVTNADSSRLVYQYDALGQVISGKKYWSDGTPVTGQEFEYGFDDIGNRKTTASGGDQNGANLRSANYTNNSLNQLTSRSVPGYVNLLGTATNTATVTLWNAGGGYALTSRKDGYYRGELPVANTSALWLAITNMGVLNNGTNADIVTNIVGNVFVPKTPEGFTHDLDGNLTSDGRWTNFWDAENRLVTMETLTSVPDGAKKKLVFGYDCQGRRISKTVSNWVSGNWQLAGSAKFVYDAWNLIAELDSNNGLVRSAMWGLDLSGAMQGAGGVGGLLQMAYHGAQTTNCFSAYDGNGNVTALVNAGDGKTVAQYEYGPFGELIRATGPMAKFNPFRFSTKYQDDETDFLYYGYRYYNPSRGRWLSRDPIGELGFQKLSTRTQSKKIADANSLYAFVANSPLQLIDALGLEPTFVGCSEDQQAKLKDAIQNACKELRDRALSCCAGQPYRFFGSLVGQCNSMDGVTISCMPESDKYCTDPVLGDACARAEQSGSKMWVCPSAFTASCGSLTCTVLHEIVHLAGGNQDQAVAYEECSGNWGNCNNPTKGVK